MGLPERQDGERPPSTSFPTINPIPLYPTPPLLVWFILEMQKHEKPKSRTATKAKSKLTFLAFIVLASLPIPGYISMTPASLTPRACSPSHKAVATAPRSPTLLPSHIVVPS